MESQLFKLFIFQNSRFFAPNVVSLVFASVRFFPLILELPIFQTKLSFPLVVWYFTVINYYNLTCFNLLTSISALKLINILSVFCRKDHCGEVSQRTVMWKRFYLEYSLLQRLPKVSSWNGRVWQDNKKLWGLQTRVNLVKKVNRGAQSGSLLKDWINPRRNSQGNTTKILGCCLASN